MFATSWRNNNSRNQNTTVHLIGERLDDRIALTVDITSLGAPMVIETVDDLVAAGVGDYFGWADDFQIESDAGPMGDESASDNFYLSVEQLVGLDRDSTIDRANDGSFIVSQRSQQSSAQMYDNSGNRVGDAISIPGGIYSHDVAKSNETAVIAWGNDQQRVSAQIYDGNGDPVLLEPLDVGSGWAPAVSMAADGSFVVVWESGDDLKPGVLGQKFDAAGQPNGHQLQIDDAFFPSVQEWGPDVAIADNGNFVVSWGVWFADIHGSGNASAQRFDSNAAPVGTVIQAHGYDAIQAEVETDSSGNFVTWWNNGGGSQLQAFTADLVPDRSAILEIDSRYSGSMETIVLDESGKFLVFQEKYSGQPGVRTMSVQEYQTSFEQENPPIELTTEQDDVVEVVISETEYSITTNGGTPTVIPIAEAPQLQFAGLDGNDTLTIVGSTLDDQVYADGDSGEVTLFSNLYELVADGFERVTIKSGGGNDSAELYGSTDTRKRDRLFAYPTETGGTVMHAGVTNGNLINADFVFEIEDYLRIDSFGRGGWDYASLFGTNDNDHFYRFSDYEVLIAKGMIQKTKDFPRVDVFGRHGNDSSHLSDSAGDDKFFSFPEFSVMLLGEADKDRVKVHGFEHTHVNSREGGTDTAYLSRVHSTDSLFAIPEIVWMTRASRFETLLGFHSFIASADEDETPFLSIFDDVENLITTGTWIDLV